MSGKNQKKTLNDFPDIIQEWDYDRNEIPPESVTAGSGKKRWWKCKIGHSWESVVGNRTKRGDSCPYCSGQKVLFENSLESTHPRLLSEWDYALNSISPSDCSQGSGKKVWWRCGEGHSWQSQIINRTSKNTNCPFCANYYVSSTNSLQAQSPELAQEWHPTKNGKLTPSCVVAGAAKKVWWLCSREHEWQATLNSRFSRGTGCPKCSNQSSKGEMRILAELSYLFDGVKSRVKMNGLEVDIYIPSVKVGIEYDGAYYHGNSQSKDRKKNKKLDEIGITLIRVREPNMEKISKNDLILSSKMPSKNDLNSIFQVLSQFGAIIGLEKYLESDQFVNEELFRTYIESFPNPLPGNSILDTHPDSKNYWDYDKNKPLTPVNFSKGSEHKAWWKCDAGHSTQVVIHSKIKNLSSCSVCSNKNYDNYIYEKSIENTFPELTNLWHPTKNRDLKPSDIGKGSNKKVWFQCVEGHEWRRALYSVQTADCPHCKSFAYKYPDLIKFWDHSLNRIDPLNIGHMSAQKVHWICDHGHRFLKQLNVVTRMGQLRCPTCRTLEFSRPELCEEWDYQKNGELKPSNITRGSTRKVWWLCPRGHSYKASVGHRTDEKRPTGCPVCRSCR